MNVQAQTERVQEKRSRKQGSVEAAVGWVIWGTIYAVLLLCGAIISMCRWRFRDFRNKSAARTKT